MLQSRAHAKFPEAVEAHVRLKVDPRRGDQMVRGAAVLPFSLGKPLRIAVFAEGPEADEARQAGARASAQQHIGQPGSSNWPAWHHWGLAPLWLCVSHTPVRVPVQRQV